MAERYKAEGNELPEFSSKDFNTLLPPHGHPSYFAAAVFPAKYVYFFYSAFSLHWLSQIPEEVVDKKSMAYNEGRVFIVSKELKSGGSMFLVFLGRTSSDPTDQGGAGLLFGTHFQDAWDDLVQQGLIASEKRDNFNIPIYAASLEEFKEAGALSRRDDAAEIGRALAPSCWSVIGDQLFSRVASRAMAQADELLHQLQFFHIVASLSLA
ncbi:Indole-3-acetate O-methyltransferase 1 [Salvia divinorum]|uniref:Indole-3-acetate O-methyltransferase 1 n=1 Tax=Salvia divinorum TaxID=28513 RepID=A0ABD1IHF5_SALDI